MPTAPVTPEHVLSVPSEPEIIETPLSPGQIQDRMLRYARNPACPECGTHPVICTMRRPGYSAFRCRVCGHKWEAV